MADLNFIFVHQLFEEIGSLTVAGLAQTLAVHFVVNPIEIIDDTRVNSGERFSGTSCDWKLIS